MPRPVRGRQWRTLRARILNASDICWICGQPGADSIDHIVPIARGGTDDVSNLAPACLRCNLAKSDKPYAPIIRRSGALD